VTYRVFFDLKDENNIEMTGVRNRREQTVEKCPLLTAESEAFPTIDGNAHWRTAPDYTMLSLSTICSILTCNVYLLWAHFYRLV
jgi:hypothetical protein